MNKSSQKLSKKHGSSLPLGAQEAKSRKFQKLIKNATVQDTINRDRLREEISKVQEVVGIYREQFNKADDKLLNLFFGE